MSREVVGLAPDDAVEETVPVGLRPAPPPRSSRHDRLLVSAGRTSASTYGRTGSDGQLRTSDRTADPTAGQATDQAAEQATDQATDQASDRAAARGADRSEYTAEVADAPRRRPGTGVARLRRWTPTGLVLAVLVAGTVFGWTGSGSMSSSRQRDDLARTAALVATVLDMSGRPDSTGSADIVARVRVVNVGAVPVTVTGAERGFLAARIDQVSRLPADLAVGARLDLQLSVQVACWSPNQLALPALSMRRPDGVLRPVPIDGATAELARVCNLGDPKSHTLVLQDVRRDGDRLRLVMVVPSGRTVRIMDVAAGEISLTGRPLPSTIDGQPRAMWLDAPSSCDVSWRTQGFPRTLDLTVDGTIDGVGRSHVVIDAGYALAGWLLSGPCRRVTS